MLKKRFKIATIVTNRHQQISKWMKQNAADTDHRYDIWHLEKCRVDFFPPNFIHISNSSREEDKQNC